MNDMSTVPTAAKPPVARSLFPDFGAPMGWLRSEIDRLFDGFDRPGGGLLDFAPRRLAPVPALEMTDAGKEYRLTAELPGLTEKDVEIGLADGILTISGEKKEEQERKEDGFLMSERRYGSFRRQIGLPSDVQPDAIAARFKDGVLTVTLPKDEKALPSSRKIPIAS